ncbi:Protein farnesyltransferase/geranylgeranyltransferase type-1 subunit alpha [Babesia sp. Xinjiang]|uniref:Protein farnesyltransferase/geranylgeranyltransferase type-1 subunit alpha n=1 Tax=Babesia sp. Xinjiang TaxID=462227 RepID=UPI000A2282A1|nr:Protein farnesyltransferase/geranylgeranyltransferase type-1 subunit alpha [Babesia sp. Xinjiang]ORM41118.1 Protein farnesyltransferase/geranylgeranyltransferase type-1 subunit alpha [Babesia sp. Xinjiang]
MPAQIRDNEGVVHTVRSPELGYPCGKFIADYELLDDSKCWEDIETEIGVSDSSSDGLFKIRSDHTDDVISCYLAHFISTGEYSSRGIYIASLAIKHNPANYSAWAYRMDCSERLHLSLEDELDFARKIAFEAPKSYQAWQYRRRLCQLHNNPYNEIDYVKLEIANSPKNHCAWAYLSWLAQQFDMTEENVHKELEFLAFLLDSDIYNNTAWVYKSFVLNHFGHMFDEAFFIKSHVDDLKKMLSTPWNESLSQYLVNAISMLSNIHTGCLKLDSCGDACTGDIDDCVIKAIDSCGQVTTPIMMLKRSIVSDDVEILQVS